MWLRFLAFLGVKTLEALKLALMTLRLSSALWASPQNAVSSRNASQTVWSIGGKLVFLLLTVGFLAAVTVFQLCLQMGRFLGDPSLPGKGFVAGVLAVAPLLSSLMLALHSGPGLALDAVLAEGPDPRLWLAPRARAFLVMTPALGVFAVAGAFSGGLAAARMLGVDAPRFWFPDERTPALAMLSLVRLFAHGAVFPAAAAACGFLAQENEALAPASAAASAFFVSATALLVTDGLLLASGFWVLGWI